MRSRKLDAGIALGVSLCFNVLVILVLKGLIRVPDRVLEMLFTLCLPAVLLAGQVVKQSLGGMITLALVTNLVMQTAGLFLFLRILRKVSVMLPFRRP